MFLSIKQSVDEYRQLGRFLLTGSANALMLPKLSDSPAGRLEVIPLLPLSECEIQGVDSTFFIKVLSGKPPTAKQTRSRTKLIKRIIAGGFPEPLGRENAIRRTAWYVQYMHRIIQKDIKDLGHLEHLDAMPRLIRSIKDFLMGIILYDGDHSSAHGERIYSIPIGAMWE